MLNRWNKHWDYKIIGIKDLLTDEELSSEEIRELGNKVSKLIRKFIPESVIEGDYTLEDIIFNFECCNDIEEFNGWLEELYNWGDTNKTCWIG